jgi:hypothetical protein
MTVEQYSERQDLHRVAAAILTECDNLISAAIMAMRAASANSKVMRRLGRTKIQALLNLDGLDALAERAQAVRADALYGDILTQLFTLGDLAGEAGIGG